MILSLIELPRVCLSTCAHFSLVPILRHLSNRIMSSTDAKIATLKSHIVQSASSSRPRDDNASDLDDEELFAQLEEELENDSNAELREHGIKRLQRE